MENPKEPMSPITPPIDGIAAAMRTGGKNREDNQLWSRISVKLLKNVGINP